MSQLTGRRANGQAARRADYFDDGSRRQGAANYPEWKPGAFHADFYCLVGHLWEGDQEIDRIESAFLVWSERAIAKGPALNFRDNYLRLGTAANVPVRHG